LDSSLFVTGQADAQLRAWNSAIAAFFTAGAAKGSSIFLSVDQEALEDVAERFSTNDQR
jgi:hypothetical protein